MLNFFTRRDRSVPVVPYLDDEVVQARRSAKKALADAEDTGARVDAVTASLRGMRQQNHFAERIRVALEDPK